MEKIIPIEKWIEAKNITASSLEGCSMKAMYDDWYRWSLKNNDHFYAHTSTHLQFYHYMCDRFDMYQYDDWSTGRSNSVFAPYSWKSRQLKYAK